MAAPRLIVVPAAVLLLAAAAYGWGHGFFRPVGAPDLPGVYQLAGPWGSSTLALERDGTFEQTLRSPGGEVRPLAGRWFPYRVEPGSIAAVDLVPYLAPVPAAAAAQATARLSVRRRGFEGMRLGPAPGSAGVYTRQSRL
jgi:hypothetical protein